MKKVSFYSIAFLLTLAILLAVSEVLLRVNGLGPRAHTVRDAAEPTMHEPHPLLGWRSRPGDYVVPAWVEGGDDIRCTFLPGGLRRTGPGGAPDSGAIVLVGGSYTEGWAISDPETMGWKLQERFPERPVLNWGTAGYGTYQCLLVLEEELPRLVSPRVVVYGLIDHDEVRNVAPARWLASLQRFSRRGHAATPYATLDSDGRIVRHPPEAYLSLPLHEHLATVAFVERVVMDARTRGRDAQGAAVTRELLRQMRDVCTEEGATLVVALLRASAADQRRFRELARSEGIAFVDCVVPLTDELRVPGEGHPNGRAHALWVDRLAPFLEELFASSR
jgi:hypothetical protein